MQDAGTAAQRPSLGPSNPHDNHTPAMWQCARSTLEPGTGYNKQKMRVVWLVSVKSLKKVLFPGQGAFTHSAHTVAPYSLSVPLLTNRICPDLGPA